MLRKKNKEKGWDLKTAVRESTLKNKPVKFNLAFLFGVSYSLINVSELNIKFNGEIR